MKLTKLLIVLVVLVLICSCFALVACKKKSNTSNGSYNVVQDAEKVNVVIAQEVITTQSELDQNGTFAKYDCDYEDVKNASEGLLTFFKNKNIYYEYNGSFYNKIGDLELSSEDISSYYRLVVFTTVTKDQDTTDTAKIINYGKYNLVQTNKQPQDLSFEEGCVIVIAKVKLV